MAIKQSVKDDAVMQDTVNENIFHSKDWVYINGLGEKNSQ